MHGARDSLRLRANCDSGMGYPITHVVGGLISLPQISARQTCHGSHRDNVVQSPCIATCCETRKPEMLSKLQVEVRMRCFRLVMAAVMLIGASLAAPLMGLVGAEPAMLQNSSLRSVPVDAEFYFAWLRNREKWNAVATSEAWERVMQLPLVQYGKLQAQVTLKEATENSEWFRVAAERWNLPENRELRTTLVDLFADEVFVYGDESMGRFLDTLDEIDRIVEEMQLALNKSNEDVPADGMFLEDPFDGGSDIVKKMLEDVAPFVRQLHVPHLVVGFRVADREAVLRQWNRLAQLAEILEQLPGWDGRFRKEAIAGRERWVLTLEGRQLLGEEVQQVLAVFPDSEALRGIIDHVSEMKLTVGIGLAEEYLLVAVGDSQDHLRQFGNGESLAAREEFAPLRSLADGRLSAVSYQSARQAKREAKSWRRQLMTLVQSLQSELAFSELSENFVAELSAALPEFAEAFRGLVGSQDPGATMSYELLLPAGVERFSYRWGDDRQAGEPLKFMRHDGGNPLAYHAGRWQLTGEQFTVALHWGTRALELFQKFLFEVAPEDAESLRRVREEFGPVWERATSITRDQLLPSLDGQVAWILDGRQTSTQWTDWMPPADRPLPLPSLACVLGLKSVPDFLAACDAYRAMVQDMLAKLHDLDPQQMPSITLPVAEQRQVPGGLISFYRLPAAWSIRPQIAPNRGHNAKLAVLSYSPQHTARILAGDVPMAAESPRAVEAENGVDTSGKWQASLPPKPLTRITHVRPGDLMQAIEPWLLYAIRQATPDDSAEETARITEHLEAVTRLLASWKVYEIVEYREDNATITWSRSTFADRP